MTPRTTRFLVATVALLGLLTWPTHVASAQDQQAGWSFPDPEGDPSAADAPNPGVPVPIAQAIDILEVGIRDEDEVGLTIYVNVADIGAENVLSELNDQQLLFVFTAKLAGTDIDYRMRWFLEAPRSGQAPTGTEEVDSEFCFRNSGQQQFGACFEQRADAVVDWDASEVRAYVTKDALMGRDGVGVFQPDPSQQPTLSTQDSLVDVQASTQFFFPAPMQDQAPDDGSETYQFTHDAANVRIGLSVDRGDEDQPKLPDNGRPGGPGTEFGFLFQGGSGPKELSVTPGLATLIPLRLDNHNAGKRIVALSTYLENEASAKDWGLKIAPAIQVPGDDARVVNLIVNASKALNHRDSVTAIVEGRSSGFEDELAAARLTLVASLTPGPDRKTLYFHAYGQDADDAQATDAATCLLLPCAAATDQWMNTLESDDQANLDDGVEMPLGRVDSNQLDWRLNFGLDTPLAHDLVVDTEKEGELVLAFDALVPFPARVEAEVVTTRSMVALARAGADASIGSDDVTLTFRPLQSAERIEAQADEGFEVRILITAPVPSEALVQPVTKVLFTPSQSSLTLPFVPDPEATTNRILSGPAFVSINPLSGVEAFLNPGKVKLFNATIQNEGLDEDIGVLKVWTSQPSWDVRLLPGGEYRLSSGDAARVTIWVEAPADAKESDAIVILVNATSQNDPASLSQMRLEATVTTGLDIPDERDWYQEDEENSGKVIDQADAKSPGLGLVLGAGAAAFAVAWMRRRRA